MNEETYIGLARNKIEVRQAIDLANLVFYNEKESKHFIYPQRSLEKNSVVVVVFKKQVVGAAFIHERELFFREVKLPVSFLSYICIHKDYRKKGLSTKLMDKTIQIAEVNKNAASIVIARKAVDHYYTQFSFYGFSNYPKIEVRLLDFKKNSGNKFIPLTRELINEVSPIYHNVYVKLTGACYRSLDDWYFIIDKAKDTGVNLNVILNNESKIIGYIAYKNKDIFEFSLIDKCLYESTLTDFTLFLNQLKVCFHFGNKHPLFNEIRNLDFTYSYRECWYGGHMMRINNEAIFKKMLYKEKGVELNENNRKGKHKFDFLLGNLKNDNEAFNLPLMDQL